MSDASRALTANNFGNKMNYPEDIQRFKELMSTLNTEQTVYFTIVSAITQ